MDMIPIYNPYGTISFNELGNPNSMTFRCSDNLIDYVVADGWVANAEELIPAAGRLALKIANPLAASSTNALLRLSGLEKAPVRISLYNIRGQKQGGICEFLADSQDEEYYWNLAGQFPDLSRVYTSLSKQWLTQYEQEDNHNEVIFVYRSSINSNQSR